MTNQITASKLAEMLGSILEESGKDAVLRDDAWSNGVDMVQEYDDEENCTGREFLEINIDGHLNLTRLAEKLLARLTIAETEP
jgi:hypothetical protein